MEIFFFSSDKFGSETLFFFCTLLFLAIMKVLVVLAGVPCIAGSAELSVRANVFTKES